MPCNGYNVQSKPLYGIGLIVCSAMLWGTTGTAQTFATLSMSSYWIGTARLVVSAIFFALCIAVFDRQSLAKERLARIPWTLILIAAISMCVYNLAFFAGVRSAGVAVGTALALGSGPVWAGLVQALWLRRMPSMVWWFAISVAIAGLILASSDSLTTTSDAATTGLILCLISGLSYAMFALVTKQAVAMAPASMVTAMTFTIAALLALPAAVLLGCSVPTLLIGSATRLQCHKCCSDSGGTNHGGGTGHNHCGRAAQQQRTVWHGDRFYRSCSYRTSRVN